MHVLLFHEWRGRFSRPFVLRLERNQQWKGGPVVTECMVISEQEGPFSQYLTVLTVFIGYIGRKCGFPRNIGEQKISAGLRIVSHLPPRIVAWGFNSQEVYKKAIQLGSPIVV
jgi:hypothetical protein